MPFLSSKILRDVIALRPAAGDAGRIFFSTDEGKTYRDSGSIWQDCSDAGVVTSVAGHSGAVTLAESDITGLVTDLAAKAPLASPTFTGTPAAPTPSTGDNSTKLATTAYVQAQGYATSGFTNPMTTAGDIIYGGASGTATRLGGGTSGYVLTSNGTTSAPSWQAGTGGGTGAPTTSKYLLGAADGALSNAAVVPGLFHSVDAAPAVAGSLDDEFDSGSLSGSWTWNNQGSGATGATVTLSNSRCVLVAACQAGYNMHAIFQTAPSPTWEVTCEATTAWAVASQFNFAGLIIRESATDKRAMITLCNTNAEVRVHRWTSSTSGPTNIVQWFNSYATRAWFRINYDGTNIIYSVSLDGVHFQQVLSEAKTASFTTAPDQVGLCVSSGANDGRDVVMSCDWFRRTV